TTAQNAGHSGRRTGRSCTSPTSPQQRRRRGSSPHVETPGPPCRSNRTWTNPLDGRLLSPYLSNRLLECDVGTGRPAPQRPGGKERREAGRVRCQRDGNSLGSAEG